MCYWRILIDAFSVTSDWVEHFAVFCADVLIYACEHIAVLHILCLLNLCLHLIDNFKRMNIIDFMEIAKCIDVENE